MKREEKLELNASDYAISHCDTNRVYTGLEVHKMLCDAYVAGNNEKLDWMKFTIFVKTDSKRKDIKEKCCDVLAEFLKREGYFSVEYNPNEIDIDSIGKA